MPQRTLVFNGDADGLLAQHQWQLAFPASSSEPDQLITGCKRDIALLQRVQAAKGDEVCVFDVSLDRNFGELCRVQQSGTNVRYFDHHRATKRDAINVLQLAAIFDAHIDTSAHLCTSLIVSDVLHRKHHAWAVAAVFGDNLPDVAYREAQALGLTPEQIEALRGLGHALNYNSYGPGVADLLFDPALIARRLRPYLEPWDFLANEDIVPRIQAARESDLASTRALSPSVENTSVRVFVLPDAPWAHRVSGEFANACSQTVPAQAHAIVVETGQRHASVSIRAPKQNPQGADTIALAFGGGGRHSAAGIDEFPLDDLPRLVDALNERYR